MRMKYYFNYNYRRTIDLFVSITLLILLLPLFIFLAAVLKLTGEGEVFYYQERIGLDNKTFKIWKFATMLKDSLELLTGNITVKDDPRVTRMGRVLRKTKINELPQLFNVLKGEMTLIGPRPLPIKDFETYSEEVRKILYKIKPGITGIGSVIFRDEEEILSNSDNLLDNYQMIYDCKGELEVWYQQNQSLKIDLIIVILTIISLVYPSQDFTNRFLKNIPTSSIYFLKPKSSTILNISILRSET